MLTWSKVWLVASFATLVLSACGKDNGQQQVNANTPGQPGSQAYQQDCFSNGGVGCNWDNYPRGFTQYPRNRHGQYAGYQGSGYYSGYQNRNLCPYGTYQVNRPRFGLACMRIQNPNDYYLYGRQAGAQTGGYLEYCNADTRYASTCSNGGYCRPLPQVNPQYYNYNDWTSQNSEIPGICQ